MSNVYSKLQKARKMLQETKLNKSGRNKFSNYDYFELSDFLPRINELFDELGLCSAISFKEDMAILKIFNSENAEEVIEFNSPMAEAELKGCQEIQILGAKHSYMRRYMYLMALEIVENDLLEENTGKQQVDKPKKSDNQSKPSKPELISEPQAKRLYVLGKGKDTDIIKGILSEFGFTSAKEVTKDKYTEICQLIETL